MSVLDHPVIAARYFFPRPDLPTAGEAWSVAVPGAELAGARVGRHGARALLHFHGNGEVVADWVGDFASALEAARVDAFFAEYRGFGGSTGRPAMATMLDDALAAIDATGCAPEEVVVYGRSIGSLFALHVAAHRPVRALVLESGIADVHERLALRLRASDLGVSDEELRGEIAERFDHRAKMGATRCPVLVLHTQHDGIVGSEHAERLAQWAGPRAELVVFAHGDHNSIHAFNGDEILRRVIELTRSPPRPLTSGR